MPFYDVQHELRRKELLKLYFSRTAGDVSFYFDRYNYVQIAEENYLMNELKKIQNKQKEMKKIKTETSELIKIVDEIMRQKQAGNSFK